MSDLTQALADLECKKLALDERLAQIDATIADCQYRIELLMAKYMPQLVDDRVASFQDRPDTYARRLDDAYQIGLQQASGCFDDQE